MPRHRHALASSLAVTAVLALVSGGCGPSANVKTLETVTPVPGVDVTVEVYSLFALEVAVANRSGEDWSLLWDESSYVDPEGVASRLVREVRRYDDPPAAPQPPSPLPPGSRFEGLMWLDGGGRLCSKDAPVATGRLNLVFARGQEHQTWSALVHLDVVGYAAPENEFAGEARTPSWKQR